MEDDMRKMSKAAKAEAYDAVKTELSLYQEYAWHLVNNEPADASENIVDSVFTYGCRTEFLLYGAFRASGGVIAIIQHDGHSNSLTLESFDNWLIKCNALPYGIDHITAIKIVAERMAITRRKLFNGEEV
jgi:hypothetical protein